MKPYKILLAIAVVTLMALVYSGCQQEEILTEDNATLMAENPALQVDDELAANNLSFPVIWSDGFELEIPTPPFVAPQLDGEWWYVWGIDPENPSDQVCSCRPDNKDPRLCQNGTLPGDGESRNVYKAYLQKDENNIWKAYSAMATEIMNIDLLDWGDNLESRDWNLSSKVRTELVLYENMLTPVVEYSVRHVSGWGNNEEQGLQTYLDDRPVFGPGTMATLYSHNSRLTIQKLNVHKDSIIPGSLTWVPNVGWTESDPNGEDLVNEAILNQALYESGLSHENYSAEVNVKGKVIYGYTWNVSSLNQDEGYYRITFSFDENGGIVPLNTFIDEDTEVIVSSEGHNPESGGGGTAMIDLENNLTYMDVHILQSGGGGGGGGH